VVEDKLNIDPWSSTQSTDYSRIIDQFGLSNFNNLTLPNPSHLHRRGIVFAHRDFDLILNAQKTGDSFGVLTGLMPSGRMHLGHSMVIEQVKWLQKIGGDVTIAVADLESQATRGINLTRGRKIALEEYIANYAALGLDSDSTDVYFQSSRSQVQRLGFQLGTRTNLSEFESIYGFKGDTNLAHIQAPMVQVGDILHPQTEEFGGLRPIVVPVGVDQDPHLRLTRGIASKSNWFNLKDNTGPGILIGLSVQEDNAELLGQQPNGRIDKGKVAEIFNMIVQSLTDLGFSDINSNPKQGTIVVPSATKKDITAIRMKLLNLERKLGGLGLLAPSSTYHHFAVGLTGQKMSSSKPKTTIFLDDDISTITKKIKRAYSGGQSTIEEHRRLGGNPDVDVAYQYLMYFFETDDDYLSEINKDYRNGKILAGEMKQICVDKASEWMINHQEMKAQTQHLTNDFLAGDAL
tara:strand:+ start:10900 stop:12285 length:1386 start_codon:yes stop_codon:yes gene_type:complete